MNPVPPPSPPCYGSRGQRLKSRAELEKIRSISAKKCAAKRYTKHMAPMPPSLVPYADYGSSGAGSSHAPSPESSSSYDSQKSYYRDYMTDEHTESSDESDGDRITARDFVDNDEDEARITARLIRRSELQRCREINDEALLVIERQKAEEVAVERLRRKKAAEAEGVIVVNSDDDEE